MHLASLIRISKAETKFVYRGKRSNLNNPLFEGFTKDADEQPRYDESVFLRVGMREDELRAGYPSKAEELFEYDLVNDPTETQNLAGQQPMVAARLQEALESWNRSVEASVAGQDYPEGEADASESEPRFWMTLKEYEPYFEQWSKRPEYASRLK